ncbi:Ppx/GppA phosphatase family protein [Simiduia aestuariiviva]|uniref:Exopolyphosphatase/guanosine-5'-triphosphate, 3'-diphosphate pyrophosphatase n=1 Tax=Simiduia aestuariiviva TaxID=1510459 RepID=A0A839UTF2_9GAMM|nr:Ppx/GppA phosphatase family protein [Simiduia aestuariiviva]MBB3168657.1 exopolyphosphatase/guanosine-5'-triphosphate,3'-diphosphate pyrophosphatase [Simiduia aestuariiviva]
MSDAQLDTDSGDYYAAVDLGSNSFHLMVAKLVGNRLEVVDRYKEMVQIARGLDARGTLSKEVQREALEVLGRINQRLRDIKPANIRAVGTKTLRAARNADKFLRKAETELGHPIHIISGYEEARLVYQGVVSTLENNQQRRLVIDIGGGSTEFIIGQGQHPRLLESLSLGCVVLAEQHFKFGPVTRERMDAAYLSACAAIEPIAHTYRSFGWDMAMGSSGTMRAAAELMTAKDNGLITRDNLQRVIEQTIAGGEVSNTNVPKLRRDVLPAGLAIIQAIFDQLKLDQLHIAEASLKEGLIYETLGRAGNSDSREESVHRLMDIYQCDRAQGERVAEMAQAMVRQLNLPHINGTPATQLVRWAALLHEIGLHISHNSFHKHSYYLLRHHDMGGFARYEQHWLASLVRLQRNAIKPKVLEEVSEQDLPRFLHMVACLRLAVILCRGRDDVPLATALEVSAIDAPMGLQLKLPAPWLNQHPLTAINLYNEAAMLSDVGYSFNYH